MASVRVPGAAAAADGPLGDEQPEGLNPEEEEEEEKEKKKNQLSECEH